MVKLGLIQTKSYDSNEKGISKISEILKKLGRKEIEIGDKLVYERRANKCFEITPAAPPAPVAEAKLIPPSDKSKTEEPEMVVEEVKQLPVEAAARGMEFEFNENMKDIFFEFDKFDLTEESKRILEKNAEWLKENTDVKIMIEGHCDERGTIEYNITLGERRSLSTRNYLAALGIDPSRIFTISYGEEKPFDQGHNEEAWANKRRAHFTITK